jgi:hypothetical protein
MSTDHCVYVGSMIKVKPCKVKTKEKVFGCKECDTEALSSQKFCSECGKLLKKYEKIIEQDSDIWPLAEKYGKVFNKYTIEEIDDDIYILEDGGKYGTFVDSDGEYTDLKIPEKAPADYFSDVTKILTAAGMSFEIKYCIVSYWS